MGSAFSKTPSSDDSDSNSKTQSTQSPQSIQTTEIDRAFSILQKNASMLSKVGESSIKFDENKQIAYIHLECQSTDGIPEQIEGIPVVAEIVPLITADDFAIIPKPPQPITEDDFELLQSQYNQEEFSAFIANEPLSTLLVTFLIKHGQSLKTKTSQISNFNENSPEGQLLIKILKDSIFQVFVNFAFNVLKQKQDFVSDFTLKRYIRIILHQDIREWQQLIFEKLCDETQSCIFKSSAIEYAHLTADFSVSILRAYFDLLTNNATDQTKKDKVMTLNEWFYAEYKRIMLEHNNEITDEAFFLMNEVRGLDSIPKDRFIACAMDKRILGYLQVYTESFIEDLTLEYLKRIDSL